MTPRCKLQVANILMLVGISPLILGIGWILTVLSYAQRHRGEMGGSDAFLMIAVLIVTYAFAVVVGGASALWSAFIVKRTAGVRTKPGLMLRIVVGVILFAPLLGYLWLTFRVYF